MFIEQNFCCRMCTDTRESPPTLKHNNTIIPLSLEEVRVGRRLNNGNRMCPANLLLTHHKVKVFMFKVNIHITGHPWPESVKSELHRELRLLYAVAKITKRIVPTSLHCIALWHVTSNMLMACWCVCEEIGVLLCGSGRLWTRWARDGLKLAGILLP